MDISSHLVQRMLGLPPPATRDLVIERDLPVPMADGAVPTVYKERVSEATLRAAITRDGGDVLGPDW